MLPKLTRTFLLFCTASLFFSAAVAQQAAALFQVIHLPRKANYSKEKLNTELSPLKNKDAVKKLLRSKNFPANTSLVIYINRLNNQSAYWTINTSAPADKEDNRIILQSRDNANTKVFKVAEFRNLLKDTLAVIDTLSIELFIRDEDYPAEKYLLSMLCGKKKTEKKIPFDNGKLVFTKDLISNCKDAFPAVTLYNNSNADRTLASFRLRFLTAEEKETLLSIASFIRKQEPGKDQKELALQIYTYALNHFGKFYFPQLLNWLEKNNAANAHGDH